MTRRVGSGQLRALVALRWRMVRSTRTRLGLGAMLAVLPCLCALAVVVGASLPGDYRAEVLLLLPSALLGLALLTLLAPLTVGGANELFPPDQLLAYPVRPSTHFLAGLLLAPLNLAWGTQLVFLVGAVAYAAAGTGVTAPGLIGVLVYVGAVTVLGQAVAWGIVGVRHTKGGRWVTWAMAGALLLTLGWLVRAGRLTSVLDESPTRHVVIGVLRPPDWRWLATNGALLASSAAALLCGLLLCAWATRRTGEVHAGPEFAPVRRRAARSAVFAELVAVDRASVTRSRPLRRGLLVLGVLPGLIAAISGLGWADLSLLPGLVAAGAGLLFGVNAFALDGSGALWLATLPHSPTAVLLAKVRTTAEVCVVAVLGTLAGGMLRAPGAPSAAELSALCCAVVSSVLVVTATCARLSVTRPHRADLRHARDAPAPPATMAVYSTLLALRTTLLGLGFALLARTGDPLMPILAVVPVTLLTLRSLLGTFRLWSNPTSRAHVVTTVAVG